jgi:hypothetical protein
MGIFKKLFGGTKISQPNVETIQNPKILLCTIGEDHQATEWLIEDRSIYQDRYRSLFEYAAKDVSDFVQFTQNQSFDIAHLFIHLDDDGTLQGKSVAQLMKHLAQRDVKFILFADCGPGVRSKNAFHASQTGSIRVNFLVTLDRRGDRFCNFFRELFALMANGESFFTAWVKLAPQAEGPWMDKLPSTYVVPGRGDLKFIP